MSKSKVVRIHEDAPGQSSGASQEQQTPVATLEKKSKKRKHSDGEASSEIGIPGSKHNKDDSSTAPLNGIALPHEEAKPRKKAKSGKDRRDKAVILDEDHEALTNGSRLDPEESERKRKKQKKNEVSEGAEAIEAPSVDEQPDDSMTVKKVKKHKKTKEGGLKGEDASNTVAEVKLAPTGGSSAEDEVMHKKRRRSSYAENEQAAGLPGTSISVGDGNISLHIGHERPEMDEDLERQWKRDPDAAVLDTSAPADGERRPRLSKKEKKALKKKDPKYKNDTIPSAEVIAARIAAVTGQPPPYAGSSMNPEHAAMIKAEVPEKPIPSGPIDEAKGRRTFVIKDFLPFVVGSEWSRRRAIRRGKAIRRSPRSIRQEARELMQQYVIRDAIERGEVPPKFEKPPTRRQLREEKKARKRTPEARALKFQRRRLQRDAQLKRNQAVKELLAEGKYDDARELERSPLFPPEERKKHKILTEDDEEGFTDTDDDSSTDPGSVTDSGSSTDDIDEYTDSENELTEEQKAEAEEARRKRRAERREKRKVEKEARKETKKTKRERREERYASMPEIPPPVLPVPKFKTITKGIPLPFTKRRGSLKELKMILDKNGLSEQEQQAYIHKAMVDKQEAINIKQSRRAAMRRDRKRKRGIKKHDKHIRIQKEMAVNRREKMKRRAAGEFVETSSEKKARHRRERAERDARKEAERDARKMKVGREGSEFIPI